MKAKRPPKAAKERQEGGVSAQEKRHIEGAGAPPLDERGDRMGRRIVAGDGRLRLPSRASCLRHAYRMIIGGMEVEGGLLDIDLQTFDTLGAKAPLGDGGRGSFERVDFGGCRYGRWFGLYRRMRRLRRFESNRRGEKQLRLRRGRMREPVTHTVSFEALRDFAAPIELYGQIAVSAGASGRRDRNSFVTFDELRVAKAADNFFGAIHGAALHTGLYHRHVLRCGRYSGRARGGCIL